MQEKGHSIYYSAQKNGINRRTLNDYILGYSSGRSAGNPGLLTPEEETSLKNYCTFMAERGFGMTNKVLVAYAEAILRRRGVDATPSKNWCSRFRQRNGLTLRTPNTMDRARVSMSSEETVKEYIDLLEKKIKELDLTDKPESIWNMDETGFSKDCEKITQKIITPKGVKNPYAQQVFASEHITVVACTSAGGRFMPNAIVYKDCIPDGKYADSVPKDYLLTSTPSGYINRQIFDDWFSKVFLKNLGRERPVLLLMDNHETHLSPDSIDLAIQNNVEILALPAHTSHFLQPLDQIFGGLKSTFGDLARTMGLINSNLVIRKNRFAQVLQYAMDKAWSPHVVKESFRKTGVSPVKFEAIDKSFIRKGKEHTEDQTTNEVVQSEPCDKCGHVAIVNPLVSSGLVSESLKEVLMPPELPKSSSSEKRATRVTGARVLTGEEFREELKKKEQEKEKKEVEKRERAEERERKKEEAKKRKEEVEERRKERERRKKEKGTGTRSRVEDGDCDVGESGEEMPQLARPRRKRRLADPIYTCAECDIRGYVDDEDNGVLWIGCDDIKCGRWYHYECLDREKQIDCDLSLISGSQWICSAHTEE